MTIGWSFIENFENDSQPYKHTSRNVSEQKRCTINEKYDKETNSCKDCEDGTYQSADNHTLMNCKTKDDLILNGYNLPRPGQSWFNHKLANKYSIDECRQHVLDEKKKGNKEYDNIVIVGHRNSKHRTPGYENTCWYIRNNDASNNTIVNALKHVDDVHQMMCVDSDGNPIECNISKENCNGVSNHYYSASDNLCKPHTTCRAGQSLSGATGTSAGICSWDPINCEGKWSSWSNCSKSCGGGTQSRTYTVTTPAAHGGAGCGQGDGRQEQSCNTHGCPVKVNCVGRWSGWSGCSKSCGGGLRSRTYTISTHADGGTGCDYYSGQIQLGVCNTHGCPVSCSGRWGSWSGWSRCITGCNSYSNITRTRRYTVDRPAQHGGAGCPHSNGAIDTQSERCYRRCH
jgi:hypothetical protein